MIEYVYVIYVIFTMEPCSGSCFFISGYLKKKKNDGPEISSKPTNMSLSSADTLCVDCREEVGENSSVFTV